jgi:hypothetical protein
MDTTKTEQAPEQNPAAAPQLAINDLAAVVQMIDVVSRRGAFEGSELTAVGALRAKFADFVQASAPKPAAPSATEEPGESPGESGVLEFPAPSAKV